MLQVDDLSAGQDAEVAPVYDDEYMEFDPYLFIRKLPPLDAVVPASRVALLPRQVPARSYRSTKRRMRPALCPATAHKLIRGPVQRRVRPCL